MAHQHGEHCDHHHGGASRPKRSLQISFAVTLGFMAAEAVGGWLTNSLALLSDAGHMLTDAAALGLSLLALRIGEMPPSPTETFGYRRFEILAALLNGLALWAIVGVILHEAYGRLRAPQDVNAWGMMAVAGLGLVVNLVSIRLLHAHKDASLNVRGAFLHVVADCLGSVGAVLAALLVLTTGWTLADPLVSLAICGLILWSSWGLVRDSVHMLLLGVPAHLDYAQVEEELLADEDVCCIYDLHLWAITSGQDALSAHLVVPDGYTGQRQLLERILERLRKRFGIEHVTLQVEESHEMREARAASACAVQAVSRSCSLPPQERAAQGRGTLSP